VHDEAIILLVEDQPNDYLLIRRAFDKGQILNPLFVVTSGEEAVAYLSGRGRFHNRQEYPLPDLMLLDLKLPGMDGFDVLRWVRAEPGLSSLVIVVLTSSNLMFDVNEAYKLGANSFLVKPTDFDNYVATCRVLKEFWLKLNKKPETGRNKSKPENTG